MPKITFSDVKIRSLPPPLKGQLEYWDDKLPAFGYRTNLGRLKTLPHIGERLLNHVSARSEVEMIYDKHLYLDEMREAVARYEAWFRPLIENAS